MTLTSAANRVKYDGDDVTTSFPVTFVFWDLDNPQATHTDGDGTETTWTRGTQYTMSGGSGATGTLTIVTSPTDYTPATGETLTIKSELANTQPTSIPSGGALPSSTVEQQLDQIVRQVQQLSEEVGRSFKLKISSSETDVTVDDLDGNVDKFLQVNTAEDGFTYSTVTSSGTITDPVPVANGGTGSTTAATALTALAAAGTGISNTFSKTQIWAKGGDLTCAATLVLGTDGNYFDVAGNTGPVTSITVSAGTWFTLQFDSTPTLTDSATLDLGGADITAIAGDRMVFFATAANTVNLVSLRREGQETGSIVQVVNIQDGANSTGTTAMVMDDSIPENDEGDQVMSLVITPKNASNILIIQVVVNASHSVAALPLIAALFQDSTVNALASMANRFPITNADTPRLIGFSHKMTAGLTTATTFKVRIGSTTGATTTFNGDSNLGETMASSITIWEIAA